MRYTAVVMIILWVLRWMSSVQPSSFPLSRINGCTPLHDKCLPPSLIEGVNVKTLVLTLPSGLI